MPLQCHRLIKETAIAMATDMYEELMKDNTLYAAWKSQCPELTPAKAERLFISQMWQKLVEPARATLAKMLEGDLKHELKEEIFDALLKDRAIRPVMDSRPPVSVTLTE